MGPGLMTQWQPAHAKNMFIGRLSDPGGFDKALCCSLPTTANRQCALELCCFDVSATGLQSCIFRHGNLWMDEDLTRGMHWCRYFLAQRFDRLTDWQFWKPTANQAFVPRPADILPLLCRQAKQEKGRCFKFQKGQEDLEEFEHHSLTTSLRIPSAGWQWNALALSSHRMCPTASGHWLR